MAWKKLGLVFEPGQFDWMHSHAQNPLPEILNERLVRVHFACRDRLNRAHGGFCDIDFEDDFKVVHISAIPTIGLGSLGAFDDCGVMPSALVQHDNTTFLYYTGWSKAVEVPFSFHIGLATSGKGDVFERFSLAPVLGRNYFDPYITGAPYVLYEQGKFRMWYISGTKWEKELPDTKPKHYYTVKYAESDNGIDWQCSNHLCIPYEGEDYAIARPVVWKDKEGYQMWFTHRGGSMTYRIGSASSKDGLHWIRHEKNLDIDVSPSGWDSDMVCYAHPVFWKDKTYMLYNGNSYGATGFGIAVLE